MKIAITGASGLVGSNLCRYFINKQNEVVKISRSKSDGVIYWDPSNKIIDSSSLEGIDVLIHLAGENIGTGRWTEAKKEKILQSRIQGTTLICEVLAKLKFPPRLLLTASAIGIYGDQPSSVISDETSSPGVSFLGDVVQQWEAATRMAKDANIRVVNMRFGIVLSRDGGALAKMLLPFKLGLGGKLGSGQQIMSWIANDEIPHIIDHITTSVELCGPINVVTPYPVTNKEFSYELARMLHRPVLFTIPTSVIKLIFGEMGGSLLLEGNRVMPEKLIKTGYNFIYPTLPEALNYILS